jgi:hypothetical protein
MTLATVEVAWRDNDRYWMLTLVAFAGALVAVLFAVIGIPPMPLHSPFHYMGVMAPSCGLTRGTVAFVDGSLYDALRYNPASPLVLAGVLVLIARGGAGAITGRWLDVRLRLERLGWFLALAAAVTLTVNQQLHADLLR